MVGTNQQKINWYRTSLDRDKLAALNKRSDALGFAQTLGHLGLLGATSALAFYAAKFWSPLALVLVLFLHGTIHAFLLNAFHEFCHGSVFKTKWLNTVFLAIISFLGGMNPVMFWTSHQEHHKYTLHPPDDLEVVLPVKINLETFLKYSFINPWGLVERIKIHFRHSVGRLDGDWENALFPSSDSVARRQLFGWARVLLVGHALITIISLAFGWWLIPVLITLAPFYGGLLLYLCNNTQHVGLQDNAADYRLCTRTILLNPVFQFLYWHMNFHTEHHMYAAVPCYHLQKLHQAIEHDLPPSPVGLYATWQAIIPILQKQKVDPAYQYSPELPVPATN